MSNWRKRVASVVVAFSATIAMTAMAAEKVGIVLMHGKKGNPEHMSKLASELSNAGYLVISPELPWSANRAYDRSLAGAHSEIDMAVMALKEMGAGQVVIGGHSMGANMAIGYAATHPTIAGVLALGPGQTVEAKSFEDALGSSVSKAQDLIADGKGDVSETFMDLHLGKLGSAVTTPLIYASYFDPAGLANMPVTVKNIEVPFLWTVGTDDKNMLNRGHSYAFDKAVYNPANQYAEVKADHMGTPDASIPVVLAWMKNHFQ